MQTSKSSNFKSVPSSSSSSKTGSRFSFTNPRSSSTSSSSSRFNKPGSNSSSFGRGQGTIQLPGRSSGTSSSGVTKFPGITGKQPGSGTTKFPGITGKQPGSNSTRFPGITGKRPETGSIKFPGVTGKRPDVGNIKLPGNIGNRPSVTDIKVPGLTGKRPGVGDIKLPGNTGRLPVPGRVDTGKFAPGQLGQIKPGTLEGLNRFRDLVSKNPATPGIPKIDLAKKIDFKDLKTLPGNLKLVEDAGKLELVSPESTVAKRMAIQNLSLSIQCHWWIDLCIGWNWHHHHVHWWNHCYTPGYWTCWTPCHYQVVYCPSYATYTSSYWYFGVECMLIPDMACYGIQEVKPHSPAARAGLLPGDMIVSVNGMAIDEENVLQRAIQTSGGRLELVVVRDGVAEPIMIPVQLMRVRALSY